MFGSAELCTAWQTRGGEANDHTYEVYAAERLADVKASGKTQNGESALAAHNCSYASPRSPSGSLARVSSSSRAATSSRAAV